MSAVDPFDIPMRAVEAFDALSGLRVTVHDLSGNVWPFLRPERSQHTNPFCQAVKDSGYDPVCTDTDQIHLHPVIAETPEGQIKVCPAGLVECVVPLMLEGRLAAVLFAGVATPGEDLVAERPSLWLPPKSIRWPSGRGLPEAIGAREAEACLESLRQLAARLVVWWQETGQFLGRESGEHFEGIGDFAARRFLVRRFVYNNHRERVTLRELARELHLSESRAAHVVKDTCGLSFVELLTRARVSSAAALLRHSDLSVVQVALNSGFGDVSHFSRTFKARTSLPPARYRELYRRPRAEQEEHEPSRPAVGGGARKRRVGTAKG